MDDALGGGCALQSLRLTVPTVMSTKALWSLALLLLTPFDPALLSSESCLSNYFYGNIKDGQNILSLLRPDRACFDSWIAHTVVPSATIVQASQGIHKLVWLEELAVEETLKSRVSSVERGLDAFLGRLSAKENDGSQAQVVINAPHPPSSYEILYRTPSAALISIGRDNARVIDTLLPPFWRSTLLPSSPIPFYPIPHLTLSRVEEILAKLEFDSTIASIVGSISVPQMRSDLRFLTGEDGNSGIISRHSFSPGALTAASWLKFEIEATGATCILKPFLVGFAPNVIWCVLPSFWIASILLSEPVDTPP